METAGRTGQTQYTEAMSERPIQETEIELKVEVTGDEPVPELSVPGMRHLPGAEHQLSAQYFDTADRALARSGAAFRHRRGGSDDGWHLKERTTEGVSELRWPDSDELPEDARRELSTRIGDAPIEAIATMHTHRTTSTLQTDTGEALIEVADDRVSATDHPTGNTRHWREWEAELLVEDVALGTVLFGRVDRQLRAAGATPAASDAKIQRALGLTSHAAWANPATPASALVTTALRDLADRIAATDAELRADAPDRVHQTRVLVRRSRSLLDVFGELLSSDPAQAELLATAKAELRTLGTLLGKPRDAEVALAAAQNDQAPDAARTADLQAQHRDAHRSLVDGLDSGALTQAVRALREAIAPRETPDPEATPGPEPRTETLNRLIRGREQRLRDGAERLLQNWEQVLDTASEPDPGTDPAAPWSDRLHRVRKDARRVRYALEELSRGSRPEETPTGTHPDVAAGAIRIQDLLGDARDRARFGDRDGSLTALAAAHSALSEFRDA